MKQVKCNVFIVFVFIICNDYIMKTETMQIRINSRMKDELKRLSEKKGISMTKIIINALAAYLREPDNVSSDVHAEIISDVNIALSEALSKYEQELRADIKKEMLSRL